MVSERELRRRLADELRELRRRTGVAQIDVVARTGMTQSVVSDFFRGRYEAPGWDRLQRIAHALGYEIRLLGSLVTHSKLG